MKIFTGVVLKRFVAVSGVVVVSLTAGAVSRVAHALPAPWGSVPGAVNLPLPPYCGQSFRRDSFGLGIRDAFTPMGSVKPERFAAECFELGHQHAQSVLESGEFSVSVCRDEFARGLEAGHTVEPSGSGHRCFQLGWESGVAELHYAAREGDSRLGGTECVREYQRGVSDARSLSAQMPRDDRVLWQCYTTGYMDTPTYPALPR